MRSLLEQSIKYAECDLQGCRDELAGILEIETLHRNSFCFIAQGENRSNFYVDQNNLLFQPIAEKAKAIVLERAQLYDALCRKYLSVDDIIEKFAAASEDNSVYNFSFDHQALVVGGLINGATVLNYAQFLQSDSGPNAGFVAYQKVFDEIHSSAGRRVSVIREMGVFQSYISLCKQMLMDL